MLTVRCWRLQRGEAGFAGIEMRDTGTGIPAHVLPHIFAPFFTTRSETGTGLGLATVRDIVAAAGGTVAAESTPGAGTCMRIDLPLDIAPAADQAGAGGGTVLLVEDEPVSRRLAERAISAWGWHVLTAGSAEAALGLGALETLAAVVSDMELPGRSGAALVAELRGRTGMQRLPAVIVSGHSEAVLRRDPAVRALVDRAAPATLLLCKPYPLAELKARLDQAMAGVANLGCA